MKKMLLFFCCVALILTGCQKSRTTDTWSTEFETHEEKIAFFEKYVDCPSEVVDTEFHIFYHDNGRLGPSDWWIRAAIKITPGELSKWTVDMDEVEEERIDTDWWSKLNIQDWDLTGEPLYYKSPVRRSYLAVYEKQGIILKYIERY